MAKGPMYVKDFNFSSAGKTVGLCNDGMTKMASGGYYSKGGMKEAATGEMYPSRRAMMKHESMETPRMQREEVMQSRTVKAPMRRQMPVAPTAPMIQPGGMKKGGFVKGGTGMVKTEGTLGIKGNKNPGEKNGKPTTATKKGNVPFKKGGEVKKYADGGPATQTGALNQMAMQASSPMSPSQIARQQALAAQAAGRPLSQAQQMANLQQAMTASQQPGYNPNMQQQNLSGTPLGSSMQGQNQGLAPMSGQPLRPPPEIEKYQQMQQQAQPQRQMPQQTMLSGSQPMPPGMQQGQQPSPQMMQQMMAQMQAARAGQGMPGQQAPQGQQMPTQQGMQSQFNGGGLGQYVGAGMGQTPPQQSMPQQAPMGMGMGQFGQQQPQPPMQFKAGNPAGFQMAMNQMRGR